MMTMTTAMMLVMAKVMIEDGHDVDLGDLNVNDGDDDGDHDGDDDGVDGNDNNGKNGDDSIDNKNYAANDDLIDHIKGSS